MFVYQACTVILKQLLQSIVGGNKHLLVTVSTSLRFLVHYFTARVSLLRGDFNGYMSLSLQLRGDGTGADIAKTTLSHDIALLAGGTDTVLHLSRRLVDRLQFSVISGYRLGPNSTGDHTLFFLGFGAVVTVGEVDFVAGSEILL